MTRDYEAEFHDPETQGQIMLKLFLAGRPLTCDELSEQMDDTISAVAVAGNCGELRAKGWVTPARADGITRIELTVTGTDAVRQMFPPSAT